MYPTWHLRCSDLKRTENQDLGEQHRRKATTTPRLIITSFLMTDQPDPQASTNLFMTRALKRTRGESATHLKPAGIYTCTKRCPRQNARRKHPQPHGQTSQEPPAPGAFPEMAGSWSRRDGKVLGCRHISLQGSPDSSTCSRPSAAVLSCLAAA